MVFPIRVGGKEEKKKKNTCCCSQCCLIACLFNFNLKVLPLPTKPRRTRRKCERLLASVRKRRQRKLSPFFPLPRKDKKKKHPETQRQCLYTKCNKQKKIDVYLRLKMPAVIEVETSPVKTKTKDCSPLTIGVTSEFLI